MSVNGIQQQHAEKVVQAIERQRNDALTREAQKDAILALLQAQATSLMAQVKEANAKVEELTAKLAAIESKTSKKKAA